MKAKEVKVRIFEYPFIFALGGQTSVLTLECFIDAVRNRGVNLQRSFYLFSIVDYDPSGRIKF